MAWQSDDNQNIHVSEQVIKYVRGCSVLNLFSPDMAIVNCKGNYQIKFTE